MKIREEDDMVESLEEIVTRVAEYMAASAVTAPKSGGMDFIKTKVLTGEDVQRLGEAMIRYGKERPELYPYLKDSTGRFTPAFVERMFARDGGNVKRCQAVLLISLNKAASLGLDCGGCGVQTCAQRKETSNTEFAGPQCGFRLIDLGIAIGSAVKMAMDFNMDNRMMYTMGAVARKMGLIDGEWGIGVPLSVSGKNIFFDRPPLQ